MIKHGKPKSFYEIFQRKGTEQQSTHYCPGCGHGNAHKLIAEVIDELEIQDRVIFISPVGCSVFAYYYFDTGNVQAAHGRAPAVATGLKRSLDDGIVISYQGDGDLAGIGMGSIIHAANRGENITVFFINNAIYGMTGGQMAPTTLAGQKTLTTPFGRDISSEGGPVKMAELIDALEAPIFIERVSLATAPKILKAKKAFRKALANQVEKKGFSFVEALSPCPVNWKMSPLQARRWIETELEPVFPVKNFRDREDEKSKPPSPSPLSDEALLNLLHFKKEIDIPVRAGGIPDQYIKIAGFGGQGVMSAGILLANCASVEGKESTWLPSYGPEMRGGTANASVIISESGIGSPLVDRPTVLIAMNGPSLDSFESAVQPGGLIIVNSSIVQRKVTRNDCRVFYLPASDIAKEQGILSAATIAAAVVYIHESGALCLETLKKVLPLSIKREKYIDANMKIIETVVHYVQN